LFAGASPEDTSATPFTAPPGSYLLQLRVDPAGGPCTTDKPDFGTNEASGFGYVLLGTG